MPRAVRGFTLIELLVAIAILAVIAVLSWRGLDQIIRGRQTITNAMEDERVFAQLFDQMRIDARQAVSDDEAGQPAVAIGGNTLQIVRELGASGEAPRARRRGCRWCDIGSRTGALRALRRRRLAMSANCGGRLAGVAVTAGASCR